MPFKKIYTDQFSKDWPLNEIAVEPLAATIFEFKSGILLGFKPQDNCNKYSTLMTIDDAQQLAEGLLRAVKRAGSNDCSGGKL